MKSLSTFVFTCSLMLALIGLTACDEKELCFDHPHRAEVRINTDWSLFNPVEQPTGMTLLLYGQTRGGVQTLLSNNTQGVDAALLPDVYKAVVYNQSTTEFGSIYFTQLDNQMQATALAAPKTSRWYITKATEEKLVQNPEWLGTTAQTTLPVTEQMVDDGQRHLIATLQPKNVVYTIRVLIHINNIYNLRSARAALSGMAEGYLLGAQHPTTNTATQLLEQWTIERDADNPMNGTIIATITSFGLPYEHRGLAEENTLQLSLLLVDSKTQLDYSFAVGNRFVHDDNIELSLRINERIANPLPDVKPEGDSSSGGFDVSVDDWGDEKHVDIGV